ncbi:MAG: AAA family ATPase [Clostridiales bacterium]|nr:AAA family ATPase [Clostridiales bacterium]
MKIISVHVVAFGKLKNVNLQLNSGINVLQHGNGFGKTTLASFIRAMLYGFTYTKTKGVTDVSHYSPWESTEKFGGSIVVEHDGETYRIERFFGSAARHETLRMTNERTGKEINLTKQPGEMLLGLTADSYDRSAYYPQEAVELASNDNLESRLANLVQDSVNYDKAQDKLRAYKKSLRYERGYGGKIYELECEKQELTRKLYDCQQAERRSAEIDVRLQRIQQERADLTARQAECNAELQRLQRQAAQTQLTDEDKRIGARLNELNEKLSRIPQEFDEDFARCDELAKLIVEEKQQPNKKRVFPKQLLVIGAVLLIVGIILTVLGAMEILPFRIAGAIGIGALLLAFLGMALPIGEYVGVKLAKSKSVNSVAHGDTAFLAQYITIASKYVYTDGVDFQSIKRSLWNVYSEYQGDVRERNTLLPLVNKTQVDGGEVERKIQGANNVLTALSQSLTELASEAGRLAEEKKNLVFDSVALKDRILAVDEETNVAVRRFNVADYTVKLLERAKENLSRSYLPKLCSRTGELVRGITQSDLSVVVDGNFAVSIREKGQTKPMSEFSRGIREIVLLCFRVALSELLYDGAIPFLIIDDAFVNFDEVNFVRATDLLKKLSAAQVIYLTCHDRTGNLLK